MLKQMKKNSTQTWDDEQNTKKSAVSCVRKVLRHSIACFGRCRLQVKKIVSDFRVLLIAKGWRRVVFYAPLSCSLKKTLKKFASAPCSHNPNQNQACISCSSANHHCHPSRSANDLYPRYEYVINGFSSHNDANNTMYIHISGSQSLLMSLEQRSFSFLPMGPVDTIDLRRLSTLETITTRATEECWCLVKS